MIAHPPCTHLSVSGARWWDTKRIEQEDALAFVRALMFCDIPRIAIENPVSLISTRIRPMDQIIQPHDRWKERSRTYPGIAAAMADQWGRDDLPLQHELFRNDQPHP